jgi:Tfp pilus assembly protein PilF
MGEATHKGAERFAANDLTRALAYYQDAADACPTSPRAQVNLAHLYEAMNDNAQALAHYQEAVRLSGPPADPDAVAEARAAVARLQK